MQLSIEIKNTKNKAFSNPRFYGETGGTYELSESMGMHPGFNPRFYGERGGTTALTGFKTGFFQFQSPILWGDRRNQARIKRKKNRLECFN
ncbi:MAG TPA: hypothetical protein PLK58_11115, partial [Candidatus Rifleibacterium sp.]|nr:hypothetical protein [Candidatus Rifleibacterium sp.]